LQSDEVSAAVLNAVTGKHVSDITASSMINWNMGYRLRTSIPALRWLSDNWTNASKAMQYADYYDAAASAKMQLDEQLQLVETRAMATQTLQQRSATPQDDNQLLMDLQPPQIVEQATEEHEPDSASEPPDPKDAAEHSTAPTVEASASTTQTGVTSRRHRGSARRAAGSAANLQELVLGGGL